MYKRPGVLALSLMFGLSAYAAEGPKADLFLGYSFVRYNSAQTIPAFTANGGLGTFALNFNPLLAFEAELGGYHNGNINNHQFDTTTFSYLFGPRASFHRAGRVVPYFHALFGGQDAHTSIAVPTVVVTPVSTTTTSGRVSRDQNNFAWAIGGGLDFKLSPHILVRPIQLDYLMTRFQAVNVNNLTGPSTNRNQNNLRYAAGLVFNFGGAQ
jgi:opacity protein-like surface antigen